MERREFLDRREFVTATGGLGLASLLGTGTAAGAEEASYVREEHRIESFDGVEIPAVLFVPEDGADAAVLATHGWGGSKASVEDYGPLFTAHGYAVLAFDQRGFGESTAEVGLSGPNEVHDVSALIDFLAADDRIETDPDGDPKVGMIGRSYAGGIQMNAAAVDDRIDALVPFIPWHDLSFSLAPNGVPKLGWTTFLYGLGVAGSRLGSANTDALDGGGPPVRPETFGDVENLEQGVTPRLHELYAKAIVENRIPEEGWAYLKSRSTVSKADRVDTPTLVCQGWPDTLFTPNEGHRIVEDVGADGTQTRLALYNGGHTLNGSISPTAQVEYLESLALTWFERHLRGGNVDVPELTFWDVDRGEFRTADGFPPTDAETVEFSLADLEADDANAGVGDVSSLFDVPVPGLGVATEPVGGVLDDTLSGLTGGLGGDDASSTLSVGADQSLVANTVAPTSASQILPVNGDLLPLSVAEFELPVRGAVRGARHPDAVAVGHAARHPDVLFRQGVPRPRWRGRVAEQPGRTGRHRGHAGSFPARRIRTRRLPAGVPTRRHPPGRRRLDGRRLHLGATERRVRRRPRGVVAVAPGSRDGPRERGRRQRRRR